jgi:hypothetical protein
MAGGGGGLQGAGGQTFTGLNIDAQPYAGAHRFINGGLGNVDLSGLGGIGAGSSFNVGGYPTEQTYQPTFNPNVNPIQTKPDFGGMHTWAIPNMATGEGDYGVESWNYVTLPAGITPNNQVYNPQYNTITNDLYGTRDLYNLSTLNINDRQVDMLKNNPQSYWATRHPLGQAATLQGLL